MQHTIHYCTENFVSMKTANKLLEIKFYVEHQSVMISTDALYLGLSDFFVLQTD